MTHVVSYTQDTPYKYRIPTMHDNAVGQKIPRIPTFGQVENPEGTEVAGSQRFSIWPRKKGDLVGFKHEQLGFQMISALQFEDFTEFTDFTIFAKPTNH